MQQRSWRRRRYFIRKDFQGRFVLRFFLAILLGALIFTLILGVFSSHTLTVTYEDSYLRLDRTPKALFIQILRAHGVYILILGVVISIVSVFLSHRIAGPLYRLEKSVEEISKGNLSFRITLRRKDEVKELADSINGMIDTLSGRIQDIRLHTDAVRKALAGLSEDLAAEGAASERIRERLAKASDSVENLKRTLSFFTFERK